MELLNAIVGQRAEPGFDGTQTTLTSYVGSGRVHLLIIVDAKCAPVVTRIGPQIVTTELVASFRRSRVPNMGARLRVAFADADAAIRQAIQEQKAPPNAGAGALVAAVSAGEVTFAKIGAGRAYMYTKAGFDIFGRMACTGYLGDGSTAPRIETYPHPLEEADRVLLLSDATHRGVSGQVKELVARYEPQLATIRLIEAARRRGCSDAIAALVLECRSTFRHDQVPVVDRRAGPPGQAEDRHPNARRLRRRSKRTFAGGLWSAAIATALAAGAVALVTSPHQDMPNIASRPDVLPRQDTRVAATDWGLETTSDSGISASADTRQIGSPAPMPVVLVEKLHGIFGQEDSKRSARALRKLVQRGRKTRRRGRMKQIEGWIYQQANKYIVSVLGDMLELKLRWSTRRWVQRILKELASRAAPIRVKPSE